MTKERSKIFKKASSILPSGFLQMSNGQYLDKRVLIAHTAYLSQRLLSRQVSNQTIVRYFPKLAPLQYLSLHSHCTLNC